MTRIAFYTLGCKLNYAESSALQELFSQAGYTVVPFGTPADVVIINTCTVTETADAECRKIIRRALRSSPGAFVAVTGCYAQRAPEEIAAIPGVSAIFGNQEKARIVELVEQLRRQPATAPHVLVSPFHAPCFNPARSADQDSRTRAFLKIQDGCSYRCSFCTIPAVRGPSRSLPFEELPRHLRALEAAGYREVVLTGINLGDYRSPTGERLVDVLALIERLQPRFRVRLSSIEPNLLSEELIRLVARSSVICPHFHVPLQSGSPAILRRMRRRYTVELYRQRILLLKEYIPDCAIGTDVLTGFPGETEEHFAETYQLLESLPISYIHAFTYSEREGTPAASMPEVVPPPVRKARTNRLRALSERKRTEFYRSQLSTVRTVIPEQYDAERSRWTGWTENYVRVSIPGGPELGHEPLRVRLYALDGATVLGIPLDQTPAYLPLVGSVDEAA